MNDRLRSSSLGLILCCLSLTVSAGEPPSQPMLVLETGMHTVSINRIGVDEQGKYLVTGSDDKTVRAWDLASGHLLRTFRVPAAEGKEGEVYAVAISPDGRTIVAGGWTANESGNSESIYVFDRETGRLVRRVSGLPSDVDELRFSPDGRWLAAGLGENGIRLFEAATFATAGEDRDYGGASYGAVFDGRGHLATTSFDGDVRLYELPHDGEGLRLIARKKTEHGTQPFGLSWSPDGSQLAVGLDSSLAVEVLAGSDLSSLFRVDTSRIPEGSFGCVAWSRDGNTLYAGGLAQRQFDGEWAFFIRSWSDRGRGAFRDLPVSSTSIMDVVALRAGGLVFATGGPAFGRVSASGKRQMFVSSSIADLRDQQKVFRISRDGSKVLFGYEEFGKSPAIFAVGDRQLTLSPAATSSMKPSRTEAKGLNIVGWNSTLHPTLNGQPLKMEEYETSESVAIAPNASTFLLGSEWYVRRFGRAGSEEWRIPAPGVAWDVNISGDGQLAIVAFGDGTIHWYRMTDGKELLAFFPHADKKRWVLWTPSGYYDASPGGEDLIGWHVNHGKDTAPDFFPASQFRDVYYRPDIVNQVLITLDETSAVRVANEARGGKAQTTEIVKLLPPIVEITSPSQNADVSSDTVTVRFNIRTPSGDVVTGVRALVDGRPAGPGGHGVGAAAKAGQNPAEIRELVIPMPESDADVSIIAENQHAPSVPATVHLRWRGAPTGAFIVKPKLYVLAVGLTKYKNRDFNLGYPAKDARDFAAALKRQEGGLYREVVIKVLTDEGATRDDVADALEWITKQTTSKDVAAVFLAGHGVNDQNGQFYFLPYNADTESLKRTGVSFTEVQSTVSALAGKTLFFVDACHSGNVMGSRRSVDINGLVNELSSADNGAVVFAASTGRQYSLEDPAWGNGAFTKAVVEGLKGKADYNHTGKISINMLDLYISERVKELTGGKQTPTTTKPQTVSDFPIAVLIQP